MATLSLIADPTNVNANSYCDVGFADAYHSARLFNDEWTAATPDQKVAVLVWSTGILDSLPWCGSRLKEDMDPTILSILRWPRAFLKDRDGNDLSALVVPPDIQKATAELALFMLREDRTEGLPMMHMDAQQLGPINMRKFSYNKFPASVLALINPYVQMQSQSQPRVMRV